MDGKLGKRLSSIEGGDETVAVININATAGGEKAAKTYEVRERGCCLQSVHCPALPHYSACSSAGAFSNCSVVTDFNICLLQPAVCYCVRSFSSLLLPTKHAAVTLVAPFCR